MRAIRILAKARHEYPDLIEELENPLDMPCCVQTGESWISTDAMKPEGFCEYAWISLYPYVFSLANGADDLHDGWMKKKGTALVACSDGFRPVSFLLEVLDS